MADKMQRIKTDNALRSLTDSRPKRFRPMLDRMWTLAILKKLKLKYLNQFAFHENDADELADAWAEELSGLKAEEIRRGLSSLPSDFPPNPMQFKRLCRPKIYTAHKMKKKQLPKTTWEERKETGWAEIEKIKTILDGKAHQR